MVDTSEKVFLRQNIVLCPEDDQKIKLSKSLNNSRFIYNQLVEEYLNCIKEIVVELLSDLSDININKLYPIHKRKNTGTKSGVLSSQDGKWQFPISTDFRSFPYGSSSVSRCHFLPFQRFFYSSSSGMIEPKMKPERLLISSLLIGLIETWIKYPGSVVPIATVKSSLSGFKNIREPRPLSV